MNNETTTDQGFVPDQQSPKLGDSQRPISVVPLTRQTFAGPATLPNTNDELRLNVAGQSIVIIHLIAFGSGSMFVEVSLDGQNWQQIPTFFWTTASIASGALAPSLNLNLTPGVYYVNVAGFAFCRLRATTSQTGVKVLMAASDVSPFPARIIADMGRPFNPSTGAYSAALSSGALTGVGAAAPVFAFQYTGFGVAAIEQIEIGWEVTTAPSASGVLDFALFAARSFSVADTGGTAATLTGNNCKKRTSYSTTGVGDIRIGSTGAITAGTRTLDATALANTGDFAILTTLSANEGQTGGTVDLLNLRGITSHPLILANNEGFVITMPTAMPTSAVIKLWVWVSWMETARYDA